MILFLIDYLNITTDGHLNLWFSKIELGNPQYLQNIIWILVIYFLIRTLQAVISNKIINDIHLKRIVYYDFLEIEKSKKKYKTEIKKSEVYRLLNITKIINIELAGSNDELKANSKYLIRGNLHIKENGIIKPKTSDPIEIEISNYDKLICYIRSWFLSLFIYERTFHYGIPILFSLYVAIHHIF